MQRTRTRDTKFRSVLEYPVRVRTADAQTLGGAGTVSVSFIDWSDSDGMFDLLVDFVADQKAESQRDPERHRFLAEVASQLRCVEERSTNVSPTSVIRELREILSNVDPEFMGDPVVVHFTHCIEELERLCGEGAT